MRWNGFLGALLFAAAAGLAYQPTLLALGPWLGYRTAAAAFLVLAAASYVAGLGASARRGLLASVLVGTVASLTAALTRSPPMVAALALVAIGFARSTLLYRQEYGRAVAVELGLLFGSLALGIFLVHHGAFGGAMAVWGVFLVQALYFLLAGTERRAVHSGEVADPFEVARRRAHAILDG